MKMQERPEGYYCPSCWGYASCNCDQPGDWPPVGGSRYLP